MEQDLTLPIRSPLCVHHRAMVRLLCDGREQDSTWVDVLVPCIGSRRAAEDFLATTWAPGMTHPLLLAEFSALGPTEIIADAQISRGGCRVDTRFGVIDQQFEAQLARIEEELT